MDRETGRSRGFGFITYTSSEEASSAIQALDGQVMHSSYWRTIPSYVIIYVQESFVLFPPITRPNLHTFIRKHVYNCIILLYGVFSL